MGYQWDLTNHNGMEPISQPTNKQDSSRWVKTGPCCAVHLCREGTADVYLNTLR